VEGLAAFYLLCVGDINRCSILSFFCDFHWLRKCLSANSRNQGVANA
jgi:hypothetical protein